MPVKRKPIRPMKPHDRRWLAVRERINLADLARYLGISRTAVSLWPRVPLGRLEAVSRFTGVAPEDLRPDYHPPDPWAL